MLEKNKEQFPGFAGDGIKSKIHEFAGANYYSVPPKYVHDLSGSMEENLIRKGGFSTDGDITIEITPLSPVSHRFSCPGSKFAYLPNFPTKGPQLWHAQRQFLRQEGTDGAHGCP